jgi:iron complex transport system ATP-binding protein
MLRAREVSFAYSGGPRAIDRVSLEVAYGRIVGLLGANGSGKTTLLKIAAGMLRPSSGDVTLDGVRVDGLGRRQLARRVAVVPQETRTIFDFTVLEIVLMGRYPHLGPFELEDARDLQIARAALASTGTTALEQRRFETLSGGEKQRVVIASALAQAADLLLLDEPTASLDLRYQLEVGSLLRRLNAERGTTIVLCTHDLNLAASVCHEVVLLREGRIVASGPVQETLTVANVRAAYDVDAEVRFHERAGHLSVVPIGRAH